MRALLLALVLPPLVGCYQIKQATGVRTGVPEDWTHKELADHFKKKSMQLDFLPTATGGGLVGPAGYFAPSSMKIDNPREAEESLKAKRPGVFFCALKKNAQDAKDMAGSYGIDGISSGRFVFVAHNEHTLKSLRESLP